MLRSTLEEDEIFGDLEIIDQEVVAKEFKEKTSAPPKGKRKSPPLEEKTSKRSSTTIQEDARLKEFDKEYQEFINTPVTQISVYDNAIFNLRHSLATDKLCFLSDDCLYLAINHQTKTISVLSVGLKSTTHALQASDKAWAWELDSKIYDRLTSCVKEKEPKFFEKAIAKTQNPILIDSILHLCGCKQSLSSQEKPSFLISTENLLDTNKKVDEISESLAKQVVGEEKDALKEIASLFYSNFKTLLSEEEVGCTINHINLMYDYLDKYIITAPYVESSEIPFLVAISFRYADCLLEDETLDFVDIATLFGTDTESLYHVERKFFKVILNTTTSDDVIEDDVIDNNNNKPVPKKNPDSGTLFFSTPQKKAEVRTESESSLSVPKTLQSRK